MRRARSWILGALVLALCRPVFAASAGGEPFEFLFLDANARPVALGGAYTALATDANALLYNPAGLARVGRDEATFMHNQYLQGIFQEYAAFASPYGWGANLNFLNFGDVTKTTMSNPNGSGLEQTGLSDLAVTIGYGFALTKSLALGVGVKYIREAIDSTVGAGWAGDVGGLYAVPWIDGLTLGAAVQNLGPTVRFQGAKENLPLNARVGAAYTFKVGGLDQILSVDVSKERTQGVLPFAGAEVRLLAPLAVRFGYNGRNDASFGATAGFGVQWEDWSVDYAFEPVGDIGDAHRISATLRWGSGRAKPKPRPVPVVSTETVTETAISTEAITSEQPQAISTAAVASEQPQAMSTAALAALPISVTTATPASQGIESQCPILPEFPALPTDRPARLVLRIAFTPDQSDLVACDQEEIKRVAALLEASPRTQAIIEGHADNSGLEWWNQILSESRAQSVYNALTQNFAVAPDRLRMRGFGSTRPIDSNETVEGRARNRRVEIVIEYGPSSKPRIPRAPFMPGMNQ